MEEHKNKIRRQTKAVETKKDLKNCDWPNKNCSILSKYVTTDSDFY